MTTLRDLFNLLPPVDLAVGTDGTQAILCSDAADPDVEAREALLLTLPTEGGARVAAQLEGAQRFVLARPGIAGGSGWLVVSAGGMTSRVERAAVIPDAEIEPREEEGPLFLGRLCRTLVADDSLYVGGMSRQLYRLPAQRATWERADAGLLDRSDSIASAIYGMAPADAGELVLVGGDGEIWRGRNGRWRELDSGTNLMLNAVARLPQGGHLICGAGHAVLHLHEDGRIEVVEHGIEPDFLFEIAVIGEQALVFAADGIHRFSLQPAPRYQGPVDGSGGARLAARTGARLQVLGSTALGSTGDGLAWNWIDAAQIPLALPD